MATQRLFITAGQLIDGLSDRPMADPVVVVEGSRIKSVFSGTPTEDKGDAVFLRADGKTILPGFIDAHVHLNLSAGLDPLADFQADSGHRRLIRAMVNAQTALKAGVTTVKDCGGYSDQVLSLKTAIQEGLVIGPRIVACGMPLTTTAGHCHWLGLEADSTDSLIWALRSQVKAGADFIKVMGTGGGLTPGSNRRGAQYSLQQLQALVVDARRLGKEVTVHAHGTSGIRNAVWAGAKVIAHCTWLGEEESTGTDYDPRVAEEMVARGIFVDPTLSAGYRLIKKGELRIPGRTPDGFARALEVKIGLLQQMSSLGVKLIVGTDAGVIGTPFDDYVLGMEVLVSELGFSNMGAIKAGTFLPAQSMGMADQIGSIAPGMLADLVIVDGDPLTEIGCLRSVHQVIKGGQVVYQGS